VSAQHAVRSALARIAEVDRPEVWITLRGDDDLLREARGVDVRVQAGETLPLAGLTVAVKDNIDVAGLPTTAACPEFAYLPARTATAVQRLVDGGAIVIGKTNLDQFATGLVGTRSPYGAVRHATMPERVAGGSSSGSAPTRPAPAGCRPLSTASSGSSRPSGWSRRPAWSRPADPSTPSRRSRQRWNSPAARSR
jgi:allophanate hydrolase